LSTDRPTFTWSAVTLATKYEVWLTDLATGTGQVIGSSTTTTLPAPGPLSPGHSYRWWVRADSGGTMGPWSAPTDFTIAALAAPVPSGPSGTLTTTQPIFSWLAVPLATKYEVWLTDLTSGGAGQVIGSSTTTSLIAPSTLSRGHSYRWWVRADSSNGTMGPWSAPTNFAIAPASSAPTLVVTGISPNSGPPGALVQISGTGFQPGSKVFFDGVLATLSGIPTATVLRVVVPALSAGTVDVKVVNPDGQQSILPHAFTAIVAPPPVVTGVSPNAGVAPGATIQIFGTGFQPGTKVFFGDVLAAPKGDQTATTLTVVAPVLRVGLVDVKVVNPDGQDSVLPKAFFALPS
jgi:hypothetical protein